MKNKKNSNKPKEYVKKDKAAVKVESFGTKELEETAVEVDAIEKETKVVNVEEESAVSFEVKEGKASIEAELTEEELTAKITAFNRTALRNVWKSKDLLWDFAKKELGGDVEAIQGQNIYEVVFMFKGQRVPSEGVYHIRPRG
jgi:hypothetical protein